MEETTILILLFALVVNAYLSMKMVDAAVDKGYDKQKAEHFVICFLFPVLGYLYILALPDKIVQEQNEELLELLAKIADHTNCDNYDSEGEEHCDRNISFEVR